jgi:hypothetical protein
MVPWQGVILTFLHLASPWLKPDPSGCTPVYTPPPPVYECPSCPVCPACADCPPPSPCPPGFLDRLQDSVSWVDPLTQVAVSGFCLGLIINILLDVLHLTRLAWRCAAGRVEEYLRAPRAIINPAPTLALHPLPKRNPGFTSGYSSSGS